MPSLPAVFVELKATTDQFRAQFGEAKKLVDDFAKNTTTGMQKLEGVGKVAFIGLAGAATAFAGIAVKAALEGEVAHAQLSQAVQNTGMAFSSVSPAVEAMSEHFAKLGYENDQVEVALARLVQGTGDVQASMQQMGLAADIARARHMDLSEVATGLGKIMEGNMRSMRQFGLSATDAAGNTLTASEALKLLKDRFGGAAQAEAGTYAGKLAAMNAEWHNMAEAIGNELLPVFANLAGDAADVVGWFDQHRAAAVTLAAIIGGPLVVAMSAYIAKQAVAFAGGIVDTIRKVGTVILGGLVPAIEALTISEEAAATAEAFLTAGLSVAAGIAGVVAMKAMLHSSANKEVASSAEGAKGAVGGLAGAEGDLGDETDTTTGAMKKQSDLYKQLINDTNAQQSEVLKLIGEQTSLDAATDRLKNTNKANSEATKFAVQHAKDLKEANDQLKKANEDVTTAVENQRLAQEKLNKLLQPQKIENIEEAQDNWQAAQDRVTKASIDVTDKQKAYTDAVREFGPTSKEATLAHLDLNGALREQNEANRGVHTSLQELADAQRTTIGTTEEIDGATKELKGTSDEVTTAQGKQKEAQDKLNATLKDDGAVKAAKADAKELASNTLAWQQATVALNTDWGTLETKLGEHPDLRDQLVAQLRGMKDNLPKGADAKPLSDLIDKINSLDPAKASLALFGQMNLSGWQSHEGNVGHPTGVTLEGTPTGMAAGQIVTTMTQQFSFRQHGGPVLPGQPYVVGEAGPEMFFPTSAGTIAPNDSFGGVNIGSVTILVGAGGYDEDALANKVRDKLLRIGRNNVGVLS